MSESCDAAVTFQIFKGIAARTASIFTRGSRAAAFCVLAGKQRFYECCTVSCVVWRTVNSIRSLRTFGIETLLLS